MSSNNFPQNAADVPNGSWEKKPFRVRNIYVMQIDISELVNCDVYTRIYIYDKIYNKEDTPLRLYTI